MQILSEELQDYINGICCPPVILTPNFDVTADWAGLGITDQSLFHDFITLMGTYPTTTISDFVISGNNIKCNINGGYELDLINVTEINSISDEVVKFRILSGTLSSATLDYCASVFLTANVLQNWSSSSLTPATQPSSANKTAITDLCNANGGTATF